MPVKFKLSQIKNPRDPEAPPKYFARVVTEGKDTTSGLAKEIALNTTVGRTEVMAVLTALSEYIEIALSKGRAVDLMNLCILRPSISSEGADTPEDFNTASNIRNVSVNIRPKMNLIRAVREAGLERVAVEE